MFRGASLQEIPQNKNKIFENKHVRTVWNEEEEDWYFSVVDICWVLEDSPDFTTARKHWNKLKHRFSEEGSELVTICHQLELSVANGKLQGSAAKNTKRRYWEVIES